MKFKSILLTVALLFTPFVSAEWVDFEDLAAGKEFNYKPYYSQGFEFKASRYFEGGTLFYYDFKIAANLGNSNESENFLSIDAGNNSCLPGISVKHKEVQAFDFNALDIGRIYEHDGEFSVSLLALDAAGKVLAEQIVVISEPLTRIELGDKFKNIHELLINSVYVGDIDNSVARFALDNIDINLNYDRQEGPAGGKKQNIKLAMLN